MISDLEYIKELLKEFLPTQKKIENIKPYIGKLPYSSDSLNKKVLYFGDFTVSKLSDIYIEIDFNSSFINCNFNSGNLQNIFALSVSSNSQYPSDYQFIGYKIQLI